MRLADDFFVRDTRTVARQLLGKYLIHRRGKKRLVGRIVETEAYHGEKDQACHARFGRTPRSEMLYRAPGHAYVYLIYGMHHLLNFVTGSEGFPSAVLIRALDRVEGLQADCSGPGRLTRAFGIRVGTHNGILVTRPRARLWVEDRGERRPQVVTTARIGVDYAGEWADRPWRYLVAN